MQHPMPGDSPKKRPTSVKPKKTELEKQLSGQPTEDNASIRMAHRAYEIYMERISRGPLDDWLEAEREIASHKPAEVECGTTSERKGQKILCSIDRSRYSRLTFEVLSYL